MPGLPPAGGKASGRLEEGGEPRRRPPDPFPPRHLRRQRRRAARRHHRLRPGRDLRPARGALEPPGPGPVRPRAAPRRPRGGAPAQRRPDPRGGVRAPALRPLLHDGQHAPGRRRGGLHRRRLRRPHAHHLGGAGTPGGGAGRPDARHRAAAHDRATRVSPGHTSYDEFVAGSPAEPLAEEVEGSAMLYSSGTTGHPKGIRRPLTGQPFGSDVVALRHAGRDHGLRPGGRVPQLRRRCTTPPRSCGP